MPEVEDVEMKDPQKTDEAVKDKEEKNKAKEPTQEDVDKISFEGIARIYVRYQFDLCQL